MIGVKPVATAADAMTGDNPVVATAVAFLTNPDYDDAPNEGRVGTG